MTTTTQHNAEQEEATQLSQADVISLTNPTVMESQTGASLLSALAFQRHGLRFGIEITFCVTLFSVLRLLFAFSSIRPEWQGITAWFAACTSMAVIDHLVFLRPYLQLQRACALDLAGESAEALAKLEEISPYTPARIAFPIAAYHLRRAYFAFHSEDFPRAFSELSLAREAGLGLEAYYIAKSSFLLGEGKLEQAEVVLQHGRNILGRNASLVLNQAIVAFERKTLGAAKELFGSVLQQTPRIYSESATTHEIAHVFLGLIKLKTGHAEIGLEELRYRLPVLLAATHQVNSLVPMVAKLYLERAMYYASHYEKELAEGDLNVGMAITRVPAIRRLAELVKAEINFRFSPKT